MKRRALIVRTITGAISASVFTATGWLMGTRTLTMEGDGTWGPWFYYTDCPGSTCSCPSGGILTTHCEACKTPPDKYRWDVEAYRCCPNGDDCKWRYRSFACGSC